MGGIPYSTVGRNAGRRGSMRGTEAGTLERLAEAVGIGGARFVAELKAAAGGGTRETSGRRALRRRAGMVAVLAGGRAGAGRGVGARSRRVFRGNLEYLVGTARCGPVCRVVWDPRLTCWVSPRGPGSA